MVKSADGFTWTAVSSLSPVTASNLSGISYGVSSVTLAGVFVAVAADGTVYSSADGATWTNQKLSAGLNAITYGTQFVTVGAAGNIFTSTDGATWTLAQATSSSGVVSALSGSDLYAVARGSLAYAAVGASGTNLLSK